MAHEENDERELTLPEQDHEAKPSTPEDRGDDLAEEAAPEAEPEEEAELQPEAEEVEAPAGKGVPLGRFQEINDERKALRAEVAALREEVAAIKAPTPAAPAPEPAPAEPAPFDFDAQGAAYTEALLDGEHERARAILQAIHQAQLREAQAVAAKAAQEAFAAAREEERVAAEASAAVRQYPFLADGGDPAAIAETREWWDFYQGRGEPAHLALRKAVERVGPLFAKKAEPEPQPEPEPPKPPDRAQEAKLRGAEAASRQPPRLRAGTGSRGMGLEQAIGELSEEQFEKLSAEDKRRARGDYAA